MHLLEQPTRGDEENDPEDEAERRGHERLAGRDPARHPRVGADQPQRREPPVAILAAGAHGRADDHADRDQQRDERDHDQQPEHRVEGLARARVAEAVDPLHRPAGLQVARARVEPELARPEQAFGADLPDHAPGQPRREQAPPVGRRSSSPARARRTAPRAAAAA